MIHMVLIRDIGFVGHANFVQTDSGSVPVEIALATLRDTKATLLTVNVTDQTNGTEKMRTSRWMCWRAKLLFPFQGEYTLEQTRELSKKGMLLVV
ncbi:hypothetical protein CEXT_779491 [Caerostris extrusa]|uniref:Uncharacterized protein n=1 Tax=Caerostris extrusa TaxID=172846 RepID=A0AAV4Y0N2_CAEEX|nr:hypothetical protein CEXT_779491 [Caerostris extrusa]